MAAIVSTVINIGLSMMKIDMPVAILWSGERDITKRTWIRDPWRCVSVGRGMMSIDMPLEFLWSRIKGTTKRTRIRDPQRCVSDNAVLEGHYPEGLYIVPQKRHDFLVCPKFSSRSRSRSRSIVVKVFGVH